MFSVARENILAYLISHIDSLFSFLYSLPVILHGSQLGHSHWRDGKPGPLPTYLLRHGRRLSPIFYRTFLGLPVRRVDFLFLLFFFFKHLFFSILFGTLSPGSNFSPFILSRILAQDFRAWISYSTARSWSTSCMPG